MKNYEKKAQYFNNRFSNVKKKMRRNFRQFSKEEEMEICYLEKQISDYSFEFFPEVYVKDCILRLEEMVAEKENNNDRINKQPSTNT